MPIDPHGLAELLREQGGNICARLGHNWRFVLPLQTRDEDRTVLCVCAICNVTQRWIQLPAEGYQRLLQDAAAGKLIPQQKRGH